MELPLLTPNGGKVSVHFGKITTTNLWGSWVEITDLGLSAKLQNACTTLKTDSEWIDFKHSNSPAGKCRPYVRVSKAGAPGAPIAKNTATTAPQQAPAQPQQAQPEPKPEPKPDPVVTPELTRRREAICEKLQSFFSEFTFTPACRFINTLSKLKGPSAKKYVAGYMSLSANPDANNVTEKVKSREFTDLVAELNAVASDRVINNRVRLYYGDPGTGKTTRAIKENPSAKVYICNSSLSGDDLLQVFDFNDENGHPVFKKSIIREAMENGQPIILDEINLLSMDALRTLQEITDDKTTVNFRGEDIEIKPGFKIIGTMNLMIAGQAYGLPEALVDRAEYIEEFKLTPAALASFSF